MDYRRKLDEMGIKLIKSGKQTCPKCSATRRDKTDRCLSVTFEKDAVLYNCHHCGWQGAVYYNDSFKYKKVYQKPAPVKVSKNLDPLYEYFEKRGISREIVDLYGVTRDEDGLIIFQYFKNGELVNVKHRKNLEEGKKMFWQTKDAERTLYGMDFVEGAETLVWCEGEPDILSLAQQGIFAVSPPQGGSDNKFEWMENCFDFIDKFEEHIIAVDNDKVGNDLKTHLIERLGADNCSVVNWGQYKDANEALMAGENLKEYIDNAQPVCPDGIETYCDKFEDIFKSIYEEDNEYYSTGWRSLDKLVKLRTGYLMVVTGYPSRGKSTFVDNLLVNLTQKYGIKHLIASFESTTASSYINYLEMFKQADIKDIKKNEEEVFNQFEFISDHFLRLETDRQWTIDEIIEKTESAVKKYGIKTLVIDPYNRLKNEFKDREDRYVGSILSKLCMLSKRLNILVIFVAHPKKPDGEQIPSMYSISGSGDWYNMADYGIIVHRDRNETGELENMPTIMVGKVKNFLLGKPSGGQIKLKYNLNKKILEDGYWNGNM